ncbi:Phenolphthiocerol/phthiocerol polyketide synthase subunit C ((Phenol)carboxyphthiodiolenone synthase subunit C) (Beta-ketoacyl-acyl-carrier-protein synthase I) (Phthiocerol synthesis polyketide synthase type I PpsC) [Durusdinium trenchii]|uniref:Ketosynthase family 3 (KS3) domain-containing protein n=1 Tax=Durusdinium trenchii TaxID=1381693 RepID=A0ABP0RRG5_9DINO
MTELEQGDAEELAIEDVCDLILPRDEEEGRSFGLRLVEALARKGYCVVETFLTKEELTEAVDDCYNLIGWALPKKEFEAAYLGRRNSSKYAFLDASARILQKELATESEEGAVPRAVPEGLKGPAALLHSVSAAMEPYVSSRLGFTLWGCSRVTARLPIDSKSEESSYRPFPLSQRNYEDGKVLGHIDFLENRKLCVMLLLDAEGTEIILEPFDPRLAERTQMILPCNRLLVFRQDLFSYSYRACGKSGAALQVQLVTQSQVPNTRDLRVVTVPSQLMNDHQVMVRSMACHYPGNAQGQSGYWAVSTVSNDGLVPVPVTRWDAALYYSSEEKEGFTYAIHGGFCNDEDVIMFDNEFFQISETEAGIMSPAQRLLLQTGYEALRGSGVNRAGARNLACGVFLGDSGCDWPQLFGKVVGPQRCLGSAQSIGAARLAHVLGLRGPTMTMDTACSSSLVAIGMAHTALRKAMPEQVDPGILPHIKTALAQGCNLLLSPRMYIQYSGPHMLSPRGRCFTFDSGADGYARGEGCGSLVLKMGPAESEAQECLASLIGSAVNQDGRSASMTAPNGPSQQQCIRTSMLESKLSASEINVAECHGTGTALGDPIEVSALRMVMQDRPNPILNTSAKTNLGHLEASAGMAGVLKCVNILNSSTCPANNHLRLLNPHMDTNGYPVYFANELSDYGVKSGISGVSSFGFGGTNARGDLWGRCVKGAKKTELLDTGVWVLQRQLFYDRVFHYGHPGPHASDQIYIAGSWDAFTSMQEMEKQVLGEYRALVRLGETGREHFRLLVNQDPNQIIHPGQALAGPRSIALGPDRKGKAASWLIDGLLDGGGAGANYVVKLEWGFSWERGEYRIVTWQPAGSDAPRSFSSFNHSYSVAGSWTAWKCQEMVRSHEEEGLWSTSVRLGLSGQEEFQFVRDRDWCQVIHPAASRVTRTEIPIMGPDHLGHGRNWLLQGKSNEVVTIQLRVVDGEITMTTCSAESGVQTWTSSTGPKEEPVFLISGSWNNWGFDVMKKAPRLGDQAQEVEPSTSSPVFQYELLMGSDGVAEFQLVLDDWGLEHQLSGPSKWLPPMNPLKDSHRRLYPNKPKAALGEAYVCGPDNRGHGLNWSITAAPGARVQISLDLEAEGPKVVQWTEIQDAITNG